MAKEKKKLFKDWSEMDKKEKMTGVIGTIVLVAVIAFFISGNNDSDVTDNDADSNDFSNTESVETAEAAEEEENEEENVTSNERRKYSEETEQRVIDYYNELIAETDGLILDISQEDNYDQIYVMLTDEFKYLEETDQQIIVDELGNKIENFTRATLFATPASDFLYVYFVDSHGNHLAETGHFDKGWSVN